MSAEFVILVDANDNPIGAEEKVECHFAVTLVSFLRY